MKTAVVASLLLAVAVCAWAGNDEHQPRFKPEAEALGEYGHKKTVITLHSKTYTLNFPLKDAWVAPTIGGNSEKALSKTLFEYKVLCGAGEYAPVVGTCAETGLYLNQPPYGSYNSYKRQQVNAQISCEITEPCEQLDNLVGIINGIGRVPAGSWKGLLPLSMNVVGGTGDFSHIVSGTWTFKEGGEGEGWKAELKFLYWKKEKVEKEEKKEKKEYKDSDDEDYFLVKSAHGL